MNKRVFIIADLIFVNFILVNSFRGWVDLCHPVFEAKYIPKSVDQFFWTLSFNKLVDYHKTLVNRLIKKQKTKQKNPTKNKQEKQNEKTRQKKKKAWEMTEVKSYIIVLDHFLKINLS